MSGSLQIQPITATAINVAAVLASRFRRFNVYDAAVPTGFEPAISSLTGTYARPLHHGTVPEIQAFSPALPCATSILPPLDRADMKRRRVRFLSLAAPAGVANVEPAG